MSELHDGTPLLPSEVENSSDSRTIAPKSATVKHQGVIPSATTSSVTSRPSPEARPSAMRLRNR